MNNKVIKKTKKNIICRNIQCNMTNFVTRFRFEKYEYESIVRLIIDITKTLNNILYVWKCLENYHFNSV